ncbi:hypothetical protein [Hymenobacter metallicola]|uniref:Uncharacterized protein n=1 Tax=Hymenobacter metallicola TaxID=2563114 RepID=A0A4Z0QAX5_9BACT|nr:hypothetical protein [Hymenobacter metallicola]TGE27228.1 hypothetical protein E5K02_12605 [Hymenobacter metallicola]
MSQYYQPSNRITVGGVLGLVLLGAAAAVPLAFLYVYAVWYIPFIYINVLLTLGFGAALGFVFKKLTKAGKLRNPALVGWLTLALGLWAWYVQWVVYITLLSGAGETESLGSRASFTHTSFDTDIFLGALTSPSAVLSMLPRLAESGTWSIFSVTISGFFLYLVWCIEVGIIVLFSWFRPHAQAAAPFSELAGQWAQKLTFPQSALAFADTEATKKALEAADWDHMEVLPSDTPTAHFGRVHLYHVPADPDCCYLSLENVTIETDKNGKPSEKTTDVLEYLRVPEPIRHQLCARFGAQLTPA